MSWNETRLFNAVKRTVFYSLTFRIAFLYAVLFVISFAVIFGIVYLYLSLGNLERADRRLAGIFHEVEYEYLTGEELNTSLLPVWKFRRIPPEILGGVARKFPDFKPFSVFKDTGSGKVYTLLGTRGNEVWRAVTDIGAAAAEGTRITPPGPLRRMRIFELNRSFYGEGERLYFLLLGFGRQVLAKSSFLPSELPFFRNFEYVSDPSSIHFATLDGARHRIRIAYRNLFDGNLLVIGLNLHESDESRERVAAAFLIVGISVLLFGAFCGWLLARRMLRGVERVGDAAEKIALGDYSLRVPSGAEGREIDRLVDNFNVMVANTESLMRELRTIADDIAHDLRTPLTRMLGRAEITVTGRQTLDAYRDTLGDNAEDCRHMLSLINQMLEISKTESGAAVLHKTEFDLVELVNRSAELFRMVTGQRRQTLLVAASPEPVRLFADPDRIRQLIANLLDNASKFTPPGGMITVEVARRPDAIVLSVADTGCGIPPEDWGNVFKRFYRADSSRNLPGNGLGLSMVQAVAHAHGGTVELWSDPGKGSRFTVIFPQDSDGAASAADGR